MTISPISASAGLLPLSSNTDTTASAGNQSRSFGSHTPPTSVLGSLTAGDRSLIAAATGIVISPDGSVVSGGGFTSLDMSGAGGQFAFVIALARQAGSLQGRVTPESLGTLFPPYISAGSAVPVDPPFVANALSYLSAGATSGLTSGTTSGSLLDVSV